MCAQKIDINPHEDARGFVFNIFKDMAISPGDVRDFHVCSMNKDAVRGNHYHKNGDEYIFFLGGNFRLVTRDLNSEANQETCFKDTGGRLIKIDRNTAHAIRNEGDETLYLLCFYVSDIPIQVETIRHQIL